MPMQSTRFDDASLTRIKRAAEHEGVSVSEFIRRAAVARADAAPPMTALEAFGDCVGAFSSHDPAAKRAPMDELGEILLEKHRREAAESRALREARRAR